jgi:protein TonB
MPHGPHPARQPSPRLRPQAPAVALAISAAVHGLMLWYLLAAAPAVAPPARPDIALTLRLVPGKQADAMPARRPEPEPLAAAAPAAAPMQAAPEPVPAPKPREPSVPNARPATADPLPAPPTAPEPAADLVALAVAATARPPAETSVDALMWNLLERIEAFKSYPRAARRAGLEGTARIWMQIDRDGALRGQRLESSSGHRILDEAALALVRRAAPFPPPPGATARRIEVVLPVSYRLDGGS